MLDWAQGQISRPRMEQVVTVKLGPWSREGSIHAGEEGHSDVGNGGWRAGKHGLKFCVPSSQSL
jgi:hypothetical protein